MKGHRQANVPTQLEAGYDGQIPQTESNHQKEDLWIDSIVYLGNHVKRVVSKKI